MALDASGDGHSFTLISGTGEETVSVLHPQGAIPCETLQTFLDDFLFRHPDVEIDYIHGEQALRALAREENTVDFCCQRSARLPFLRM